MKKKVIRIAGGGAGVSTPVCVDCVIGVVCVCWDLGWGCVGGRTQSRTKQTRTITKPTAQLHTTPPNTHPCMPIHVQPLNGRFLPSSLPLTNEKVRANADALMGIIAAKKGAKKDEVIKAMDKLSATAKRTTQVMAALLVEREGDENGGCMHVSLAALCRS